MATKKKQSRSPAAKAGHYGKAEPATPVAAAALLHPSRLACQRMPEISFSR